MKYGVRGIAHIVMVPRPEGKRRVFNAEHAEACPERAERVEGTQRKIRIGERQDGVRRSLGPAFAGGYGR